MTPGKGSAAADALFAYADKHPAGFTYVDVARDLGWDRRRLFDTARKLRLALGEDDTINLVCDPPSGQQGGQPWLYRLVGTLDGADPWAGRRIDDAETRLKTIGAVCASVVRATDGRSRNGRRARALARWITRAQEDLAEIDNGVPLF